MPLKRASRSAVLTFSSGRGTTSWSVSANPFQDGGVVMSLSQHGWGLLQ